MNRLMLTPERCSPVGSFEPGCYAYAFADRPVRLAGALITPRPLLMVANEDGELHFDLVPSRTVDNRVEFSYTVSVFDENSDRMWIANIVMPEQDIVVWDLIPQKVDLDAQIHTDYTCATTGN